MLLTMETCASRVKTKSTSISLAESFVSLVLEFSGLEFFVLFGTVYGIICDENEIISDFAAEQSLKLNNNDMVSMSSTLTWKGSL